MATDEEIKAWIIRHFETNNTFDIDALDAFPNEAEERIISLTIEVLEEIAPGGTLVIYEVEHDD